MFSHGSNVPIISDKAQKIFLQVWFSCFVCKFSTLWSDLNRISSNDQTGEYKSMPGPHDSKIHVFDETKEQPGAFNQELEVSCPPLLKV